MKTTATQTLLLHATRQLPAIVRRPALLKLWLLSARRAQILTAITLLLLVFALPPLAEWLVDSFYPKTFGQQIAKLFNSSDSLRETRYQQFVGAMWITGIAGCTLLFIHHIPEALRLGRTRSQHITQQSLSSDPISRRLLQQQAGALIIEGELATTVHSEPVLRDRSDSELAATLARTADMAATAATAPRCIGPQQRYRLDQALARGAAGIVYKGFDQTLQRAVAIKQLAGELSDDDSEVERFQREALTLAGLNHAHIVPIYDLIIEREQHRAPQYWFVMELLSAGDLTGVLERRGPLPPTEALEIILQIAQGLDCAHQQGLIHRDIKPENILFNEQGAAKIADFGIAKLSQSNQPGITKAGYILGSPGYMSPEQVSGMKLDARSDIYSLGVTLYRMLTDELPFQGDAQEVLLQHLNSEAAAPSSINEEIPASIDEIVLKMMAKQPDQRFATAAVLRQAITTLQQR